MKVLRPSKLSLLLSGESCDSFSFDSFSGIKSATTLFSPRDNVRRVYFGLGFSCQFRSGTPLAVLSHDASLRQSSPCAEPLELLELEARIFLPQVGVVLLRSFYLRTAGTVLVYPCPYAHRLVSCSLEPSLNGCCSFFNLLLIVFMFNETCQTFWPASEDSVSW